MPPCLLWYGDHPHLLRPQIITQTFNPSSCRRFVESLHRAHLEQDRRTRTSNSLRMMAKTWRSHLLESWPHPPPKPLHLRPHTRICRPGNDATSLLSRNCTFIEHNAHESLLLLSHCTRSPTSRLFLALLPLLLVAHTSHELVIFHHAARTLQHPSEPLSQHPFIASYPMNRNKVEDWLKFG